MNYPDIVGEIVSACLKTEKPISTWKVLRQIDRNWKRIADERVKLHSQFLYNAVEYHNTEAVAFFTSRPEISVDRMYFLSAVRSKDHEIMRILLGRKDWVVPASREIFYNNCNLDMIKVLLEDERVDPSCDNNNLLSISHPEEVVLCLRNSGRVDTTAHYGKRIADGLLQGQTKVIKYILENPKIEWREEDMNLNGMETEIRRWDKPTNSHMESLEALLSHSRFDPLFNRLIHFPLAMQVTKRLLVHPSVDPSSSDNEIIRHAPWWPLESVKLFLEDPRVDPTAGNNTALIRGVEETRLELIKLLLSHPKVDPSNLNLLKSACNHYRDGSKDLILYLLSDERIVKNEEDYNQPLLFAIRNKLEAVVDRLLELKLDQPRINLYEGFCESIKHNHQSIFKKFLPLVDITQKEDNALYLACKNGRESMVKIIMEDLKVNPSSNNNAAIRGASEGGSAPLVKLLLQDKRVNPSAVDNESIRLAAKKGHYKILELLLKDERVDPSANNNEAIRNAAKQFDSRLVRLLLADDRVDPSANNNEALQNACDARSLQTVEYLIERKEVDPSADDNSPLCIAANQGCLDIVLRLLEDDRVDPNRAAYHALDARNVEKGEQIALVLLKDRRADVNQLDKRVIGWARQNCIIITKTKRQRLRR